MEGLLHHIYGDVSERLAFLARHQVVAHLQKLEVEGRVVVSGRHGTYRLTKKTGVSKRGCYGRMSILAPGLGQRIRRYKEVFGTDYQLSKLEKYCLKIPDVAGTFYSTEQGKPHEH